ncbi:MAG TPA: dihydrofolate reductase family protein [Euzebyales bacterium]|nr:dihydrofolate reductase family protein [Euzebyales bacterium]
MMDTHTGARPHVIVHMAVSLDGAIDGFDIDVGTYYQLAATWSEDATLVGADTILAQESALADTPGPGPAPDGPLLAVVDSRARVSEWSALRVAGYWSDVIAVQAEDTPPRAVDRPATLVAGAHRVDLASALERLHVEYGISVMRVDSGGGLAGALLDADLVDEVSLVIHPVIVGSASSRRWYGTTATRLAFVTKSSEILDCGVVWLRFSRQRGS